MTKLLPIDPAAVRWSEPQSDLGNRPLVVLMHGRGSHEHDLAGLVPLLPPEPVYASLRAPLPFAGGGYTWFASGAPGAPDPKAADASTRGVLEWLEQVAPSGAVGALGFSQGGAMAIQLMRHAPERFASYVNLAGFVIPGDAPADARLGDLRQPVFWGRDPGDPMIPASAIERTQAWLPLRSTLTTGSYPRIGHSISRDEVDEVAEFLRATLL